MMDGLWAKRMDENKNRIVVNGAQTWKVTKINEKWETVWCKYTSDLDSVQDQN